MPNAKKGDSSLSEIIAPDKNSKNGPPVIHFPSKKSGIVRYFTDNFSINLYHKKCRCAERHSLCNRKCPPDRMEPAKPREDKCCRKQNHKLSCDRHNKAVYTISKRLKYRPCNNTEPCKQKMYADNAQRRNTDGKHLL